MATSKEFLEWFYKRWGIPVKCQTSTLESSLNFKNSREVWNVATKIKEEKLKSPNKTQSKIVRILNKWLHPENRGDIMDLTHDTKILIEQLSDGA